MVHPVVKIPYWIIIKRLFDAWLKFQKKKKQNRWKRNANFKNGTATQLQVEISRTKDGEFETQTITQF